MQRRRAFLEERGLPLDEEPEDEAAPEEHEEEDQAGGERTSSQRMDRTPDDELKQMRAIQEGAKAEEGPHTPGVRSFRAARAHAGVGGKAAVRLRSFVQQRGLLRAAYTGWPARLPTPRVAPAVARRRRSAASKYQQILATPAPGAGPSRLARAPAWRFLGPSSIPKGQTYGEGPGSTPSVAGRVSAIGVDPTDGSHLLVGSAGGGVWETRNRGRTWRAAHR